MDGGEGGTIGEGAGGLCCVIVIRVQAIRYISWRLQMLMCMCERDGWDSEWLLVLPCIP